jgi:integration host factor subunit beta
MTKSELIAAVALKFPEITQRDIELTVNSVFEGMKKELVRGGRIELRGFGSMEVRTRRPRSARNPKTGIKVSVASRRTAVFYPGKELHEVLKAGQPQAAVKAAAKPVLKSDLASQDQEETRERTVVAES